MALLRAALVDRDDRLQKNKADLMQAQLHMQVRSRAPRSRKLVICDDHCHEFITRAARSLLVHG